MADRPSLHRTLSQSRDGMAALSFGPVGSSAGVMCPCSRGNSDASLPNAHAHVGSSDEFRRRIDLDPPGLLASIMPAIRKIIRIYLHSRGIRPGLIDVDDLAHGIAVLLLERDCRMMKTYDPRRSSPVTWLALIVRTNVPHLLRHYMGGAKRQAASAPPANIEIPLKAPEETLLVSERLALLDRAVASLNARDRGLFDALRRFDFVAEQTARHLGISLKELRNRKHRLITRIRSQIQLSSG